MPPSAPPCPIRVCQRTSPCLSGSSACAMPDFCPITSALLPLSRETRIGGCPTSKSGPSASGQFVLNGVEQPLLLASLGVSCLDHRIVPVFASSAITASLVVVGGSE